MYIPADVRDGFDLVGEPQLWDTRGLGFREMNEAERLNEQIRELEKERRRLLLLTKARQFVQLYGKHVNGRILLVDGHWFNRNKCVNRRNCTISHIDRDIKREAIAWETVNGGFGATIRDTTKQFSHEGVRSTEAVNQHVNRNWNHALRVALQWVLDGTIPEDSNSSSMGYSYHQGMQIPHKEDYPLTELVDGKHVVRFAPKR